MALSDYLRGDIFSNITESGGVGSKALFDAHLGNRFGAFSPQARALRPNFDQFWSQYLSEILSASPESGLSAMPSFPGREQVTQPSTRVSEFLQGPDKDWLGRVYGAVPQAQRGMFGARFQPTIKRVR